MKLFREEVVQYRTGRLRGEIQASIPVSWHAIGALFFLIVVTAVTFLLFATYARVETVGGVISPEGGIAQIIPTRAGIVLDLPAGSGKSVEQGDSLAVIRTGESLSDGTDSASQILASLTSREQNLRRQEEQVSDAAAAERALLTARIAGLTASMDGLRDRIEVQRQLIASAQSDVERVRNIADKGFISRRELLQREELHLSRVQQLSELEQSLATQDSSIRETREAIRQAGATTEAQVAGLSAQRLDLSQVRTSVQVSGAYRLEAPIAGTVTALTAREGQAVSPQAPLMSIVPAGSALQAELFVPSTAIGFIEVGQRVSLALHAFPYQRFGTLPARVTGIASAPIMQNDGRGGAFPAYIVTAALERKHISAYGSDKNLISGMTLTARVITEKQSVFEWLFDPLFAVARR